MQPSQGMQQEEERGTSRKVMRAFDPGRVRAPVAVDHGPRV